MEENLNIEYHTKILLIKALDISKTIGEAAYLLGVSDRTVWRYIKTYKVSKDQQTKKHYFRPDRNPVTVVT